MVRWLVFPLALWGLGLGCREGDLQCDVVSGEVDE
jgi:hypothetical protein